MELASSKKKLRQMRALIDENLLSPIKLDPDIYKGSPGEEVGFRLKMQPIETPMNNDLQTVMQETSVRLPMPKHTQGAKRDSFSEVIGFPTPKKQTPAALPSPIKRPQSTVPLPKMVDK